MSDEDRTTIVQDVHIGTQVEQRMQSARASNYTWGLLYLAAAVGINIANLFGSFDRVLSTVIDSFSDRAISSRSLSDALNLEGRMAVNANNVVRITNAQGVGTGILVDPYTVYTAHHVLEGAAYSKAPIYIQSQSHLAEGESMRIDSLHTGNYRSNAKTDIGKVSLNRPLFKAPPLLINPAYSFLSGESVYAVCYRNREVVTLRGHILNAVGNAPRFYVTDMMGGPGNSGCGVFNAQHELVGIVIAVPADKKYEGNLDTGNIIFTDIGNPL